MEIKCFGEKRDLKGSKSDGKVIDVRDVWYKFEKIVLRNMKFEKVIFLNILEVF